MKFKINNPNQRHSKKSQKHSTHESHSTNSTNNRNVKKFVPTNTQNVLPLHNISKLTQYY